MRFESASFNPDRAFVKGDWRMVFQIVCDKEKRKVWVFDNPYKGFRIPMQIGKNVSCTSAGDSALYHR
jgi:hypothetical protein